MRIVFMGTPDFAAGCLEALLGSEHEIAAVFCQPDKPQGRKQVLTPPPVKVLAKEHGIPVYQPVSLKRGDAADILRELAPQVIVVVAYGKLLPPKILDIPPLGCVNVHASLLPKYRGAGPIQWAILKGEKETGVTTMYMAEGMDTGDMIEQAVTPIDPEETAEQLFDRLSVLGAKTLLSTLRAIQAGTAPRTPQDDSAATLAPMLDKTLSPVDWSRPASEIHDHIRGLYSWPMATFSPAGEPVKIHAARLAPEFSGQTPGELLDGRRLVICCGDGKAVELLKVQAPGKKAVSGEEFLRGRRLEKGQRVE